MQQMVLHFWETIGEQRVALRTLIDVSGKRIGNKEMTVGV